MRPMRAFVRLVQRQDMLIARLLAALHLGRVRRLDVRPVWLADSHYMLLSIEYLQGRKSLDGVETNEFG